MPPPTPISFVAQSDLMRSILARIDAIAASDSSVLLIGETGVGKELIAEYIHRTSPRALKPLVKVGLSSLPPDLLESELFGHQKGAYTSASTEKRGLFELADTGSIFLDDIDDFPYSLQSKLLRVLESRELLRVGGMTPVAINVRLITATKVDLKEMVDRGAFRSDLYYRINVVPLVIPPLRERKDDIPAIAGHFLGQYGGGRPLRVTDEAMRSLVNYHWPGNIRELRNVIQRVVIFANGQIDVAELPPEIRDEGSLQYIIKACNRCLTEEKMTFEQVVECLESNLLRQALKQSEGNRTQAAKALGMNLSTLRDKLKKYNIE